jgi:SAM-dependent methyltransferase
MDSTEYITVHLQEYSALRAEQQKRFEVQKIIVYYFYIIISGIAVAAVGLKDQENVERFRSLLFVVPILIAPLTYAYLMHEIMLMRLGKYIYTVLRPKIQNYLPQEEILLWERFHAKESKNKLHALIMFIANSVLLLPVLSPLVFLLLVLNKGPNLDIGTSIVNLRPPEKYLFVLDLLVALTTMVLMIAIYAYFGKIDQMGPSVNRFGKKRAKEIFELVSPSLPPFSRVLDVGTGAGDVAAYIRSRISVQMISLDVVNYNTFNMPMVVYDGSRMPFHDKVFDCTLLFYTLHHTIDVNTIINEVVRVTRNKVIVLEDVYRNRWQLFRLRVLDFLLNVGHGVSLPYNFKRFDDWKTIFMSRGFTLEDAREFHSARLVDPSPHAFFVFAVESSQEQLQTVADRPRSEARSLRKRKKY